LEALATGWTGAVIIMSLVRLKSH